MFEKREGISAILSKKIDISKNPEVVIAIARSVNGSIFARSFARSSETNEVTLTEVTRAAEIRRIVFTARPFARRRVRIESIENQKNVRTGRRIMYSRM